MPIIPRYNVPQAEIPTVRFATPPADTTIADIFGHLAKVGQKLATGYGEMQEKKQRVADATLMADRTVKANTEIDATLDGISSVRGSHAQAPDIYRDQITKISDTWTQGLRPEQVAVLQRTLYPKIAQGLRSATALKKSFDIDSAKATFDQVEENFVKGAARLDRPDDEAFQDLPTIQAYADELVAGNLLSAEDAAKRVRTIGGNAAYGRLQRMISSDNPALVERGLKAIKDEEGEQGSTFISKIDVKHRNELMKEGQGKLKQIDNDQRVADDRAQARLEKQVTEMHKATEVIYNKRLDDGTLTKGDVNSAASLGALGPDKQQFFLVAIEKKLQAGVPDNPQVRDTLLLRVTDVRLSPAKVQQEVEAAFTRGHLSFETTKDFRSRLASREQHINDQGRAEGLERMNKRHSEAIAEIDMALSVDGPMAEILNQQANQLKLRAREELSRASGAMVPGGVDPYEWKRANIDAFVSQLTANAKARSKVLRDLLPLESRDIKSVDELYTSSFQALPIDQQKAMFKRANDAINLERFHDARQSGGAGTAPGNTKGVPQGSSKPTSAAPLGPRASETEPALAGVALPPRTTVDKFTEGIAAGAALGWQGPDVPRPSGQFSPKNKK